MAKSNATTVEEYLAELPDERREVVATLRDLILENLPEGYQESINVGMISYEVPLERFRNTYNKQPLQYAALASQKNHVSLYLTSLYADPERVKAFEEGFAAAGKKLDMGKSCVRFQKLEDLPLELIADTIASTSADEYVAMYESARRK